MKNFILPLFLITLGAIPTTGSFDHDGRDVDGAVDDVALFETVITDRAGLDRLVTGPMTAPGTTTFDLPSGLPTGTYTARVRVADRSGNWSEFSDPASFTIDRTPPSRPTGCRVK